MEKRYSVRTFFNYTSYTNLILILTEESRHNNDSAKTYMTHIKNGITTLINYAKYLKRSSIHNISLYDVPRTRYFKTVATHINYMNDIAEKYNMECIFNGDVSDIFHVEDFSIEIYNYYRPILNDVT